MKTSYVLTPENAAEEAAIQKLIGRNSEPTEAKTEKVEKAPKTEKKVKAEKKVELSIKDVRTVFSKLVDTLGADEGPAAGKKLLKKYDAKQIPDVAAENFQAIIDEAQALIKKAEETKGDDDDSDLDLGDDDEDDNDD